MICIWLWSVTTAPTLVWSLAKFPSLIWSMTPAPYLIGSLTAIPSFLCMTPAPYLVWSMTATPSLVCDYSLFSGMIYDYSSFFGLIYDYSWWFGCIYHPPPSDFVRIMTTGTFLLMYEYRSLLDLFYDYREMLHFVLYLRCPYYPGNETPAWLIEPHSISQSLVNIYSQSHWMINDKQ